MILTLLCDPASTSDIGRHGERIILQSGVKETYEDMQAAFQRVLKQAKVPHLRINDLRRLPKVKRAKADIPASMEVEFVTGGDKKSFFRDITALQKSHKTLGVRISNKFPEYTMRANKHLHRLALIVRKENPNTKTVSILDLRIQDRFMKS